MPESAAATSCAQQLELGGQQFIDDVVNSAQCHTGDAFDALDEVIRTQLPELTPEQQAAALQGTAALYGALHTDLQQQLAKFDEYALSSCLKVPPGLLAPAAAGAGAAAAGLEGPVNEAEEAAAQAKRKQLCSQLLSTREAVKAKQRQIEALEAALARSRAEAGQLQAVVAAVAGKENALAEDAAAVAKAAMATERQVAEAGALQARQQQQHQQQRNSGGAAADGPAAERDILRRQAEMHNKPQDALARIVERLAV